MFLSSAAGQEHFFKVIQPSGLIDWESRVLRTVATAAVKTDLPLSARRAQAIEEAKKAAANRLLELVKAVNYDSSRTVGELLAEQSSSEWRLRNVLRHFTVEDIRFLSTGEMEVDVSFPLDGHLTDFLFPLKFGDGHFLKISRPLCPLCGQPWPEKKPVPEGVQLIYPADGDSISAGESYTGLIIDARGLPLHPALLPRVWDNLGNLIYGESFTERKYAVELGLVLYARSADEERVMERAGEKPLRVRAIGVKGKNGTDPVVSHSDAMLIHATALRKNYLERCRVVILGGE